MPGVIGRQPGPGPFTGMDRQQRLDQGGIGGTAMQVDGVVAEVVGTEPTEEPNLIGQLGRGEIAALAPVGALQFEQHPIQAQGPLLHRCHQGGEEAGVVAGLLHVWHCHHRREVVVAQGVIEGLGVPGLGMGIEHHAANKALPIKRRQ